MGRSNVIASMLVGPRLLGVVVGRSLVLGANVNGLKIVSSVGGWLTSI